MVVGIPADVVALIHYETTLALLRRKPLCHGKPGKTSTNNENIPIFMHHAKAYGLE
jgi:hypothetical protein